MKILQRKILLIVAIFFISNFLPNNCYSLDPPPITPVDQFFVQNRYGIPPMLPDWHLVVDGAVTTPLSLTLQNLMQYANQEALEECLDYFEQKIDQQG